MLYCNSAFRKSDVTIFSRIFIEFGWLSLICPNDVDNNRGTMFTLVEALREWPRPRAEAHCSVAHEYDFKSRSFQSSRRQMPTCFRDRWLCTFRTLEID